MGVRIEAALEIVEILGKVVQKLNQGLGHELVQLIPPFWACNLLFGYSVYWCTDFFFFSCPALKIFKKTFKLAEADLDRESELERVRSAADAAMQVSLGPRRPASNRAR